MKTEDILSEWKTDCEINRNDIGDDLSKIGNLHQKYITILFEENTRLLKLKKDQNKLKKLRWEYWNGKLSMEQLKELNWEPQPLVILKIDIPMYLDADEIMEDINLKVEIQTEKVKIIDSIIKNISQRGYQLKSLIDWEKYVSGGF